jgi:hypothetical protein
MIPTNTCTVTLADAHAHSVVLNNVPGAGAANMAGKADAARNALAELADQAATQLASFTQGDTLTITVTQP